MLNTYFGCNAPLLTEQIKAQLEIFKSGKRGKRTTFQLFEKTPNEIERTKLERSKAIFERKAAKLLERKKAQEYLMTCTDEIIDRCSDMGVTIFMPHVINPDLLKNVVEVAEKVANLTMREATEEKISPKELEIINLENEVFPSNLYENIYGKNVLIVAWKIADNELRPVAGFKKQKIIE